MKIDLNSMRAQFALSAVSIAGATWLGFGFVDFIQTQRAREVFSAGGKAVAKWQAKGPSMESAEMLVADLRAIDTKYAKKDVRDAFNAYIKSLDEAIALLRVGKDSPECDAKVKVAHDRIVELLSKYD